MTAIRIHGLKGKGKYELVELVIDLPNASLPRGNEGNLL
jgi:hypothetical protein